MAYFKMYDKFYLLTNQYTKKNKMKEYDIISPIRALFVKKVSFKMIIRVNSCNMIVKIHPCLLSCIFLIVRIGKLISS